MDNIEKWVLKNKLLGIDIHYLNKENGLILLDVLSERSIDTFRVIDGISAIGEDCFNSLNVKNVILPDSCNMLDTESFSGNPYIKSIRGNSVAIKEEAFSYCSSLETVIFNEVTCLGNRCFYDCEKLKSFDFSKFTGDIIENRAFKGCKSLETLLNLDKIMNSCILGTACFQDCIKIKNLHIADNLCVTLRCFIGCTSLSFVEIDDYVMFGTACRVFENCSSSLEFLINRIESYETSRFDYKLGLSIDKSSYKANISLKENKLYE